MDAAVGQDDALAVFVEFDNLEVKSFVYFDLAAIFFHKVLGGSKAFNAFCKGHYSAFVHELGDGALVYGTYGKLSFEGIPRIVFELFVAQRQTAVVLVDFQNLDFDGIADLGEFAGVLDLFGPREIGDVDQTVNTFFQFNEYAEVGEVADFGSVGLPTG